MTLWTETAVYMLNKRSLDMFIQINSLVFLSMFKRHDQICRKPSEEF